MQAYNYIVCGVITITWYIKVTTSVGMKRSRRVICSARQMQYTEYYDVRQVQTAESVTEWKLMVLQRVIMHLNTGWR
jgi:hypothetical protein